MVAGPVLTLTVTEALDAGSIPDGAGGFTVAIGGTPEPAARAVELDALDRRILRVRLSRGIAADATAVTLAYAPGSTPLQDLAGTREDHIEMFQVRLVVGPLLTVAAVLRGPRTLPRDAQADDGHISQRSPCDAVNEATRRQPLITDVVHHALPKGASTTASPSGDPPECKSRYRRVASSGLRLGAFGSAFGETDDLGRVPNDSVPTVADTGGTA